MYYSMSKVTSAPLILQHFMIYLVYKSRVDAEFYNSLLLLIFFDSYKIEWRERWDIVICKMCTSEIILVFFVLILDLFNTSCCYLLFSWGRNEEDLKTWCLRWRSWLWPWWWTWRCCYCCSGWFRSWRIWRWIWRWFWRWTWRIWWWNWWIWRWSWRIWRRDWRWTRRRRWWWTWWRRRW